MTTKRFDGIENSLELTFWHTSKDNGTEHDVILIIDKTGHSYHTRMNLVDEFDDLILNKSGTKVSKKGIWSYYNESNQLLTISGYDMGVSKFVTFNHDQAAKIHEWINKAKP